MTSPLLQRAKRLDATGRPAVSFEKLRAPVRTELALVEARLAELLAGSSQLASKALQHSHEAGGKRLRPLVCLLSARAVGDCCDLAITCAVMVEAIHLASLLHDDVVDESDERRGRESVRKRWGNRVSVLAGDYLAARAYHELALRRHTFVLEALARAVRQMCDAELLYAEHRGSPPSEDVYLNIAAGKTAALMQVAAQLGAWAAGGDEHKEFLAEYGRCLGMAFQMGDDLLDLYGDAPAMGKPNGADVAAGQFTLPVIHAIEADTTGKLDEVVEHIRRTGPDEADGTQLAVLVEQLGGRLYAQTRMQAFAGQAQETLASLPSNEATAALAGLADFVCQRSM